MSPAFLFCSLLAQTADRSGEATLRSVLANYGKLRRCQISISKAARDQKGDAMAPTTSSLLSYESPTRWRLDQGDYWGGGSVFTQDGKNLKIVFLDAGSIELRKAGPSLMRSNGALAPGGGSFAILFLLLEGSPAFDKLVAPGGEVSLKGNTLSVKTKDFGSMTLRLDGKLVTEIEFDNKPLRMAAYRFIPQFGAMPEDPLEVEAISYRPVSKFPKGTFDTKTKKGENVSDERGG